MTGMCSEEDTNSNLMNSSLLSGKAMIAETPWTTTVWHTLCRKDMGSEHADGGEEEKEKAGRSPSPISTARTISSDRLYGNMFGNRFRVSAARNMESLGRNALSASCLCTFLLFALFCWFVAEPLVLTALAPCSRTLFLTNSSCSQAVSLSASQSHSVPFFLREPCVTARGWRCTAPTRTVCPMRFRIWHGCGCAMRRAGMKMSTKAPGASSGSSTNLPRVTQIPRAGIPQRRLLLSTHSGKRRRPRPRSRLLLRVQRRLARSSGNVQHAVKLRSARSAGSRVTASGARARRVSKQPFFISRRIWEYRIYSYYNYDRLNFNSKSCCSHLLYEFLILFYLFLFFLHVNHKKDLIYFLRAFTRRKQRENIISLLKGKVKFSQMSLKTEGSRRPPRVSSGAVF